MLCTIVGAGSGLGAALAHRFGRGGCRLALVARRSDALGRIADELMGHGHEARGFAGDASSPSSLDDVFEEIRGWAGNTDVLIYNAAAMRAGQASDLTPERLQLEMAINLGGAVASVRNTLPAMRLRRRGTIIFTGGGLAIEPYPEWASLAAGKAALRAYSFALHKEVASEEVHVASIAICGLIEAGGPFDPGLIAERYWAIHQEALGSFSREVIYLPQGADPYYNDATGAHRALSYPIISSDRPA